MLDKEHLPIFCLRFDPSTALVQLVGSANDVSSPGFKVKDWPCDW